MGAPCLAAGRISLAPLGGIPPCAVEQPVAQARAPGLRTQQLDLATRLPRRWRHRPG